MAYDTIRLNQDGALATITLDRPERLNACSLDMADELRDALASLRDGDARALLLTGAGKGFCSGADLAMRGDVADPGERSHAALTDHYNPLIEDLVALPLPVVVAVNGAAAGIGCSLALAGDIVLASEDAYFLQAFVNIGLVPDGGASWMLPRLVGKARAMRMMMLGEKIDAARAAEWGLIHSAVPAADLLDEARAIAGKLADGPTLALRHMKANANAALEGTLSKALTAEADGQREAARSKDAVEGAMAFLQKRLAQFSGG